MVAQRRRRWANIKPTQVERITFTGTGVAENADDGPTLNQHTYINGDNQTRDVDPMLAQCRASVPDDWPTLASVLVIARDIFTFFVWKQFALYQNFIIF